jgi:NADPH-dependent 2,4-dienoyl-CoA reductase/sulfur reductase-like enzyme
VLRAVVRREDRGVDVTCEQGGQRVGPRLYYYPGSKGLKQAFDSSRKAIMALPPSSVPKRVLRERSGAIGRRWVARARAKRGQC